MQILANRYLKNSRGFPASVRILDPEFMYPPEAGKFVMTPLLYIDFDEVPRPTIGKDLFCRMHLLEAALIGKDCQIIISSSWRFHHPVDYLLDLFPESLRGQVTGVTGDAFMGRWPRHSEILCDVSKRAGQGR